LKYVIIKVVIHVDSGHRGFKPASSIPIQYDTNVITDLQAELRLSGQYYNHSTEERQISYHHWCCGHRLPPSHTLPTIAC